MNPHATALAKLMRENSYRHHLHDVFRDFVEMAACAISNRIDLQQFEARETAYMRTVAKYNAEEAARFPRMFSELVSALEDEPGDVLGQVFGELEQGNAARGQFFTPFSVCRLMADITVGDGRAIREQIEQKGFITACEPAVGAGAQIIALAEAMQKAGINYQQHLHVTAVDVDARAAHMAYLQFSLLHIPAVVIVGNTLTMEEREHWRTPAHFMGLWEHKLRRGYALGSALDSGAAMPEAANDAEPVLVPEGRQFDLFGIAA